LANTDFHHHVERISEEKRYDSDVFFREMFSRKISLNRFLTHLLLRQCLVKFLSGLPGGFQNDLTPLNFICRCFLRVGRAWGYTMKNWV